MVFGSLPDLDQHGCQGSHRACFYYRISAASLYTETGYNLVRIAVSLGPAPRGKRVHDCFFVEMIASKRCPAILVHHNLYKFFLNPGPQILFFAAPPPNLFTVTWKLSLARRHARRTFKVAHPSPYKTGCT